MSQREERARLRHTALASRQAHGNYGVVHVRAQDALALLAALDEAEMVRDGYWRVAERAERERLAASSRAAALEADNKRLREKLETNLRVMALVGAQRDAALQELAQRDAALAATEAKEDA